MKIQSIYLLVILILCQVYIAVDAEYSKDNETFENSNYTVISNPSSDIKDSSNIDLNNASDKSEANHSNITNNQPINENDKKTNEENSINKDTQKAEEDKASKEKDKEPIMEEQIRIVDNNQNSLYLSIFSIFFFVFAIIYLYGKTKLTNDKISKIKSKIEQNRREDEAQRLSERQ